MAKYSVFTPGYDPTADATAITRANLLKMVNEGGFVAPIGGVIQAERTALPNVALYPELAYFLVSVLDSGVESGELFFYNGTNWEQIKFGLGSIDGAALINGSVTLDKLSAVGYTAKWVLRIKPDGTGIEAVAIGTILENGSVPIPALAAAAGQHYLLKANASGVYESVYFATGLGAAFNVLTPATEITGVAVDKLIVLRNSDGQLQTFTIARLLEQVLEQFSAITETASGDKVLVLDDSADPNEKVKSVDIGNLLPVTGTAGTYVSPASVTLSRDGRVTAITPGGTQGPIGAYISALTDIPAAGVAVPFTHALNRRPVFVDPCFECTTAEHGYSIGDQIPLGYVFVGSFGFTGFTVSQNEDFVTIVRSAAGTFEIYHATTGVRSAVTEANWKLRCKAW